MWKKTDIKAKKREIRKKKKLPDPQLDMWFFGDSYN